MRLVQTGKLSTLNAIKTRKDGRLTRTFPKKPRAQIPLRPLRPLRFSTYLI